MKKYIINIMNNYKIVNIYIIEMNEKNINHELK